jgi:hypothetical protein
LKIVGVFQDPGACEKARRAMCDAGVEEARVEVNGASGGGEPLRDGSCELSVSCDTAEDREWIDELLRRAGSTGVWVT